METKNVHTISSFPNFQSSTSVDITIYQYGKNVLYIFYNIYSNVKSPKDKKKFRVYKRRKISRVYIELYQHGS